MNSASYREPKVLTAVSQNSDGGVTGIVLTCSLLSRVASTLSRNNVGDVASNFTVA